MHAYVCAPLSTPQATRSFEVLLEALPDAHLEQWRTVYVWVVSELQKLLTTREPYVRPTKSRAAHPFMQRDFPEIRRDKFTPGEILSRSEFAIQACHRKSPFVTADEEASAALPTDLRLAIDTLVLRGPSIIRDRAERLSVLRALAAHLEPMRTSLDACKSTCAQLIAAPFNAAWTAAVIDAMAWPDVAMPLRYIKGFASVFDVPDSGVFRADFQPAEIPPREFEANNTRMIARIANEITKSATEGDSDQIERRRQCWKKTRSEIEAGLVGPAKSRAKMDKKYGRGKWRCIGRTAVLQKGKWRCIDNAKRSKHNNYEILR